MGNIIELAKKLKSLADKGVGGEKINAEKMLKKIINKHNISMEDIEGEKTEDYFFNIKNQQDEKLWVQIVGVVNRSIKRYGKFPLKVIKENFLDGNFMVTCTASEYIQIVAMFDFYKRLYEKELDVFFYAFCKANDLLVTSDIPKTVDDLTEEEYKEYIRVSAMASKIKSETFRKQLNILNK